MTYVAAFIVFALAVLGMAVGVIFSGRKLSGSCGGLTADGKNLADCLCARKTLDICASDEGNELVALSELGYPRRKDHQHHIPKPSTEPPMSV
ncbi:MAG: hypothetical protein HQ519_14440 [Planctomycetes bacterium]|nr:hypothetical protein [Planctomycetota bacterium]